MTNTILGISQTHLYTHNNKPQLITDHHEPYFLAFSAPNTDIKNTHKQLKEKIKKTTQESPLQNITKLGEIEQYKSFSNHTKNRDIFKVYTKKSYQVPETSDYLFFNQNLYTAEHDIPYQQRAIIDLQAQGYGWLYDTNNKKQKLNVLVYDIETTQYENGKTNIPIDIIGYSDFPLTYTSHKDLETEEFSFDILDLPTSWQDQEVKQLISHNIDEEIDNLATFTKEIISHNLISGHNIIGFDNIQIYERIKHILGGKEENISKDQQNLFREFLDNYSRPDKSFTFGVQNKTVQIYPASLDTYHGTRKFYSFLNEYSLKAVAPFLGVHIPNRLIIPYDKLALDQQTYTYNKHDVQEQLGVTLNIIQQALPLSFTTGMPLDMLLTSGAVNMWDHMSLIRGAIQKKIMPPICRPLNIASTLVKHYSNCTTATQLATEAKKQQSILNKEMIRVVKYGDEMPLWMQHPYVIYNQHAKDSSEKLNYHMPGGMTIKPDSQANSHFIPWWHVVVADVGAMYPTILKAMNIGADTVMLATKEEEPDEWIWLKSLPTQLFEHTKIHFRKVDPTKDYYADKGYMLGVKIDKEPGVVNCAMTGIMSMIAKTKNELKKAQEINNTEELKQLKIMYQSVKGARNAGTHGILSAPGVTGRQFNLWGAAAITTKGQIILAETLRYLEGKDIRVVYGDTDGIYLGCSKSAGNTAAAQALNLPIKDKEESWLTKPREALQAIEECNSRWQTELNYPGFELEAENHDAMIFVKHKNYLIFDTKEGSLQLQTKGNNFKGSDKANIARKILKDIMIETLKQHPEWNDEEEIRNIIKQSIIDNTETLLKTLDLSKVELEDLTLIQTVQPSKNYKPNQDGSISTFGRRSLALENLLGRRIKSREKFRFVVTKQALPGIRNPSKSGVKPIDYMYPVDLLEDKNMIDLDWYKTMISNYINGAFGLSGTVPTKQTGLDAWM